LNPNGTRTKPGLFGTFGLTENVAVAVFPFLQLAGDKDLHSSGTFTLSLNKTNHTAQLSGYSVDRIANGSFPIGTTIALNNEAFRTKNPTFAFPANLPAVRLGALSVTKLQVTQIAASNNGLLIDISPGNMRVIVSFMAKVEMTVLQFGQSSPITFNVPYSLVGNLTTNGNVTTFGYGPGTGGENVSIDVNRPLDEFPLQLNITQQLTPGFKFNLTIKKVKIAINGTRKFLATAG